MVRKNMSQVKRTVARKQRQVRVNRMSRIWGGESSQFKGFGKAGK
jgi:hypothetical protein